MPRIGGEQSDGIQAVVLTLRILDHLAGARGEVRLTDLADALGTTKSRIHRHLQTLTQQGYTARSPDSERYRIGNALVALGLSIGGQLELAVAALPVLRTLREALGHSTVVSRLEEDGVRVLRTLLGRSQIEIGVRPGSLLTFHGSAQGKVALAFGPADLCGRILRSRLALLTPETVVSPVALAADVEQVRRQGWAVAPNQSLIGLNTLAAPIFDADGLLAGTVGINDSIQFIERRPSAAQIEQILKAGAAISRELGYRGKRDD